LTGLGFDGLGTPEDAGKTLSRGHVPMLPSILTGTSRVLDIGMD
jgi:hypothetical protein